MNRPWLLFSAQLFALFPAAVLAGPGVFVKIPPRSEPYALEQPIQSADSASLNDLRKIFENTKWHIEPRNDTEKPVDLLFGPAVGAMQAGVMSTKMASGGWGKFWTVKKPNILNIYLVDPNKDRATRPVHIYTINLEAKTAAIAGVDPAKYHALKYVGPNK